MPNISISELPDALLPLVGATTFFEVEATEGGVVVSRRVAADNLVVSAGLEFITGTSTDDPAVGGGVFDGQLLWRNANAQQTAVIGFNPAGDAYIITNNAAGGNIQLRATDASFGIALRTGYIFDPDVSSQLFDGARSNTPTLRLETSTTGISVLSSDVTLPNTGGTVNVDLIARNATGVATWSIGTLVNLDITNFIFSGFVQLIGTNVGGSPRNLFTGDPDSLSQMYHQGTAKVQTKVTGANIRGNLNNDPTTGGLQDASIDLVNIVLALAGSVGFQTSSTVMEVYNRVHGGTILIRGEQVAAGAVVSLADFDPDGASRLFQQGVATLRTTTAAAGGAEANNLNTGAGFERVLTLADLFAGVFIGTSIDDPTVFGGTFDGVADWQNANLLDTGAVGFEPAGDAFRVFNKTRGGDIALRVISTTPAEIDIYFYEGSAGQHLWRDNSNNRLMELRAGFSAVTLIAQQNNLPSSGAAQVGQFRIEISNGGDPSATFGYPESGGPSTTLQVKSFVHGGPVSILSENNAGVETVLFSADPDGAATASFAGSVVMRTTVDGIELVGDAVNNSHLQLRDSANTLIGEIDQDASFMLINNHVVDGAIGLLGTVSGPALRTMIFADPIGAVALWNNGFEVFRTLPTASGGAEANNTSTGGGFERVLTTSDRTDASVYTRNAAIVEDRTLLASASATIINNNNVLAALITDLQSAGIIQ